MIHTVDGWNPANQLRLVVYPIIYKVSAPSQVVFSPDFWTINRISTVVTTLSSYLDLRLQMLVIFMVMHPMVEFTVNNHLKNKQTKVL